LYLLFNYYAISGRQGDWMKLYRGLKAASIALIYICVGSLALAASPNDGLCPATNTKLCGMKLTLPVGRDGSV
ncbi:MAG: hypothetical protein PHE27_02665, partial [Alphaproteobacteria bacterium]|nr:hypothetical protein [Alphaproteobacteria bacterium]